MDLYLHNPTPNITGVLEETEIYRKSTQSPFQPAGVRGNWTLSSLDSPGHAWDGPWWSHGRINIWPSLSISFIVHFAQSKQTTAGCSKRRTCHLLVPFVESLGDSIPPPWCHVHHSPGSMPFNVAGPRKAQLCDAPLPSRANLEPSGAPGPRLTLRGRTWTEILRALGCLRYFFCKHHHSGASEPLLITIQPKMLLFIEYEEIRGAEELWCRNWGEQVPTGCMDGSNDMTRLGWLPSGAARDKCPKSLKL